MSALRLFALAIAVCASANASAQVVWPTRTVTVIVGYPAGSGTDSVARFLAEGLRERTGQPFIVENRPGALGNIAAQAVARSAPDGYTVLFTPNSSHGINPHLFKSLGFDPIKDFQPVASVLKVGFLLVVNPQTVPVTSVAELTAYVKARPGKLAYASGNATGQVAAEWYRQIAGIGSDTVHVSYRGVPPAVTDMLSGQIHFMFADTSFGLAMVQSGKLRALATTTEKRQPQLPDVPTMIEAGVPGYVLEAWMGLLLPAGITADVTQRFSDLTSEVAKDQKMRDFLYKIGALSFAGTPDQFATTIDKEIAKWGPIVKAAGMAGMQ